MADCQETLDELERFLDKELPSARVQEILGHIKGCTDCQGAYEFHADLKRVINTKAAENQLPEGLMDKIRGCFGDDLLSDPS
jgi:mycothiol system anti-sigma-R factor